ncbi:MAG: hypothetical protein M3Z06_04335 [Actinomycetota bacterium]|nr:hypothetical protein [Actinomycetota bacterium]
MDPARIHRDRNGLPIHGVAPAMMPWEPVPGPTDSAGDTVLTARLEWSSPELLDELFPFTPICGWPAPIAPPGASSFIALTPGRRILEPGPSTGRCSD